MRCIMEMIKHDGDGKRRFLPLLRIVVHGAPHRRQHLAVLQKYRDELVAAAKAAKIEQPIDYNIEVSLLFVDPCSPDLDNLIAALWRALDGQTLKKPAVLTSDGLIKGIDKVWTFFPNA